MKKKKKNIGLWTLSWTFNSIENHVRNDFVAFERFCVGVESEQEMQ